MVSCTAAYVLPVVCTVFVCVSTATEAAAPVRPEDLQLLIHLCSRHKTRHKKLNNDIIKSKLTNKDALIKKQ